MVDELVKTFFKTADALDVESFCGGLRSDVVWRFGNAPEVRGVDAVRGQFAGLVQILQSMRHDILGIWRDGDWVTVETRVFYGLRDGRSFDFPGCDLLRIVEGGIAEVRIFVDNHEIFTPGPAA